MMKQIELDFNDKESIKIQELKKQLQNITTANELKINLLKASIEDLKI